MTSRTVGRRTILAAAGGVLVTPVAVRAAEEPIRIGAVLSTTGPASWLGDPEDKTLRMYVEEINAKGGVLGRPLQLFIYDDGSDAAKANSYTKRLIQQDRVDLILGASTTGSTMAILPVSEAAKVPVLSLGAAAVIVEPIRSAVFKIPHSDRMAAERVLKDIKDRGLTRVALISDTGGFGKSGRVETTKVARSLGLTLALDESFGERDTDMTPLLTRVRQSDAQAVFMFGTGQAPAIIARNYRQLDLKLPLYTTHSQASFEFIRIAGEAGEGIRLPTPALLLADTLPSDDPQKEVTVAYKTAYEARAKIDVSTFGGYAYDALMLAIDAIRRAGSVEKGKLRQAIEETKDFVGVSGIFTYSPTDHAGLNASALRMVEIRNGRFATYGSA